MAALVQRLVDLFDKFPCGLFVAGQRVSAIAVRAFHDECFGAEVAVAAIQNAGGADAHVSGVDDPAVFRDMDDAAAQDVPGVVDGKREYAAHRFAVFHHVHVFQYRIHVFLFKGAVLLQPMVVSQQYAHQVARRFRSPDGGVMPHGIDVRKVSAVIQMGVTDENMVDFFYIVIGDYRIFHAFAQFDAAVHHQCFMPVFQHDATPSDFPCGSVKSKEYNYHPGETFIFVYADRKAMGGEIMKEITIVSRNEVGTLAQVAEVLGSVGVNIEAISAYEKNNNAIFHLVTNDVNTALKMLSRVPNVRLEQSDVIVWKMPNRPGELGKLTRKLANQGISLQSIYIVTRGNDFTEIAIKPAVNDFEKARGILGIK